MMLLRFKVCQRINGDEQIIQKEVKVHKANLHPNWLYYWPVDDKWMYSVDLRTVSDVRLLDVHSDN